MHPIARLRQTWYGATSSLWLVPTAMAVGAVALAFGLTVLDHALDLHDPDSERWWLIQSSASGAESILTTIASTAATVLGVVFSITIIALQLASTQYSPRVLREFMRDRGSQVVMGTFIATFIYSLLVARSVQDIDEGPYFVPVISLLAGLVLALASIGALIYFINHIAENIQVSNLVARLAAATEPLIDSAFPGSCGRALEDPPDFDDQPFGTLAAETSGYIQVIEGESLIELAERAGIVIEMRRGMGEFVAEGAELARIRPAQPLDQELHRDFKGLVAIGRRRTLQQDAEYGARQIVDIAVKAMSPSINDPTTAVLCIDRYGALLRRMAVRPDPSPWRAGSDGRLRLVTHGASFENMAWMLFTAMRVYAAKDPNVTIRVLELLAELGEVTAMEERRRVLREHVDAMRDALARQPYAPPERALVEERLLAAREALEPS